MYEFIKEKEIENIILEHTINRKKIEDKSRELIKHAFEQISSRILLQIKLHIDNVNLFKSAEKSYEKRLVFQAKYKEYIEIGHSLDALTKEDVDVIKGIHIMLNQQLLQFPEGNDNPLEYERTLMVSTGLLRIKEVFNNFEEQLVHEFQLPEALSIDFSKYIKDFISAVLIEKQPIILSLVDKVIEDLNDPEQREETARYMKFLMTQEETLKNFIYFNFDIDSDGVSSQTQQEKNQIYIYPLRQLFQDIHNTIGDINHSLIKKGDIPKLNLKNIENIVETNLMKDRRLKELVELLEDDKANTIDRLLTHVNDELKKISSTELKAIKKEASDFELHSYMFVNQFQTCITKIQNLKLDAVTDEHSHKMLQAIITTLQFKYQSLKQKDSDFHMKKLDFYLECENDFLEFRHKFEEKVNHLVQLLLSGDRADLYTLQDKYDKLIKTDKEKNMQQNMDYFSKELLFELRTFEDLHAHSLIRLDASLGEPINEFTALVDTLYNKCFEILERLDIKKYMPTSGEVFNGKLHEVIMVEASEEYKKGDIIRVQNCGFIREDQVMLRASVIVSK